MDKYFETLDLANFRMLHHPNSEKGMEVLRYVLDKHHDAGPESHHIIKMWKQERGFNEEFNDYV
jgi:hypothetical protein